MLIARAIVAMAWILGAGSLLLFGSFLWTGAVGLEFGFTPLSALLVPLHKGCTSTHQRAATTQPAEQERVRKYTCRPRRRSDPGPLFLVHCSGMPFFASCSSCSTVSLYVAR